MARDLSRRLAKSHTLFDTGWTDPYRMKLPHIWVMALATATAVALSACGASSGLPFHREVGPHFQARCAVTDVAQRSCPNHPYQCLGELSPGARLIGLIETSRDDPVEALSEKAAMEGGDLLVLGPHHPRPMRMIGTGRSGDRHIYRRGAVVRLAPLEAERCQAPSPEQFHQDTTGSSS